MRRGELHADPRLVARNDRERERDDVDALPSSLSAIAEATFASPSITGTMGCSPGTRRKPAFVMPSRKRRAFAKRRSRRSLADSRRSRIAIDVAAMTGGSVFEKRYGRLRCRRSATISRRPLVYPPDAPPSAFPSVPVRMSTFPITPLASCEPRPLLPMNPTACESSTNTSAPCRSASAQIAPRSATMPSIENTPSVAMSRCRAGFAARSCVSRSVMSLFAYRKR